MYLFFSGENSNWQGALRSKKNWGRKWEKKVILGSLRWYSYYVIFKFVPSFTAKYVSLCRIMALRKAEKEEEKRARDKIRQKLEEDKVLITPNPGKLCWWMQSSMYEIFFRNTFDVCYSLWINFHWFIFDVGFSLIYDSDYFSD